MRYTMGHSIVTHDPTRLINRRVICTVNDQIDRNRMTVKESFIKDIFYDFNIKCLIFSPKVISESINLRATHISIAKPNLPMKI